MHVLQLRMHAGVAAKYHCVHVPPVPLQELLREELAELLKLSGSSFKVELVMRLLGLSHARDTMIGSAMVGPGSLHQIRVELVDVLLPYQDAVSMPPCDHQWFASGVSVR
jgi:hypothetical protein